MHGGTSRSPTQYKRSLPRVGGPFLLASECVDRFFFRRGVEKMPVAHKQRRQIGLSAQSGVANLIILRGHSQKLSYLRVRRPRVFHHQPTNRQADWRRGAADAARAHRRGDQLIAARDMAASESGSTSSGRGPNCETDVIGQDPPPAPQKD
jgi:hypothetical protein